MKKILASIAAILFLLIISTLGLEALNNPGLNSFASVITNVPADPSAPKNHYETDRTVPFAIVSQKNTGIPELNRSNLQIATISLFKNLQADQNYQTIIVLLDPSFPANESDPFEQQAKFTFPNAKYFSILPTKDQTESSLYQKFQQFSTDSTSTTSNTLIIAQSYLNFSDYDSDLEALQKAHYKNAFDNLSKHSIDNLAFTNQTGLKAVYQIAKDHGDLKALPTFEDNTHQFQIKYLVEGAPFQTNIATITFFGDIMLGRQVRDRADAAGDLNYPFAQMDPGYLQMNDLLVANLEGPIVNKVVQTSKSIAFHFLPDIAPILKNHFFDALSAANNHTFDMGQQGFQDDYQILRANGLTPFGNPHGLADESVSTFNLNGQKIALLGLNNTDFKLVKADVVKKIKELSQSGYKVIPFIHWGIEYKHTPSADQTELAHAFIDAGAYAIIGMHPHVVETFEIYKNAPIFYSLGNAIFDQDFSPDTTEGLSTTFRISPEQLEINFLPLKIDKSQFRIMEGDLKSAFLKRLTGWGSYDKIIKDQIEKGKIVIKSTNI
jgi:poly-gamma-glutamate synthesis protein (capsule biosynthesis protein)